MGINKFKNRKDQLGHGAGDDALLILGHVLLKCGRVGDRRPPLSGGPRYEDVGSFPLTVSIGVVSLYETVHAWEPLVTSADVAMYEAERSGTNCIIMHHEHEARLMINLGKTDETCPSVPATAPRPSARLRPAVPARSRLRRRRNRLPPR